MAVSSTVDQSEVAATTQRMTGGDALAEMLIRNGVDTLFGLPGVQLDGLFNAFWARQDRLRIIHTRHEQATAYMADGYARVTGREGVCVVVPGPGLLNATAALSTAYACNSPVLCVTGQIKSDLIDHGRGLLHEIHDQLGMIRHITKSAERAMTPGEIPGVVSKAFAELRSGRMRPVEIEVPPDTLFAEEDVALLAPSAERTLLVPAAGRLEAAAQYLAGARNPVIYAGGGVIRGRAWDELRQLAELLQAPVVMSANGKGAVSDHSYLAQNQVGELELRPKADVVLVVGTRFLDNLSQPRPMNPETVILRIDIDPEEIERDITPTVSMVGDAKPALAALIDLLEQQVGGRPSRKAELEDLKKRVNERIKSILPQADFGRAMRNALPENGVVVSEMTQLGYWSNFAMPVYEPNTYITSGYQGTLGYGFPTALGAKVGVPDAPVLSINGDGGFGFALNELATMAQHTIPAVVLVFNDSAYGNVKRIQQVDLGGREIASSLQNPDYVKLAEAFGVVGRRTETADGLQTAIEESIKANEPTLIEIPVGQMPNPWKALGLR
ncbi:MAG TPA: thiamine pyrophosphate-dependent enzyme [Thermomicrobiales bacterium]|nr:thiamine pyrophosphate-dependent enzyme [Thermomicrobiales bacterium]